MIRVSQIRIEIKQDDDQLNQLPLTQLYQKTGHALRVPYEQLKGLIVLRRSIDARHKPQLFWTYTVAVQVPKEGKILKSHAKDPNVSAYDPVLYEIPENIPSGQHRPLVVGAGPGGLFAAYVLARAGLNPILIERGKSVEERTADVEAFWETGVLKPGSNVQFGEGGAGTFSDGKLNTLVKDKNGRNGFVLDTFIQMGAPESIRYDAKPHIGTDILRQVVANLRQEIINLGGQVRFETQLVGISETEGRLTSVTLENLTNKQTEELAVEQVILAIGHSARDTFAMLHQAQVPMEGKAFAVGFRVEHDQIMIDQSQYGCHASWLPPSPYKLSKTNKDGRGVYSFCMCPGGYVVNASSEEGRLAVNGMSYADRGSANANTAIVVTVGEDEFDLSDPMAGIAYQRQLEEKAYELGQGRIPQQLFGDFKANVPSTSYGTIQPTTRGETELTNLRGLLSPAMEETFLDGMKFFGNKIKGYDRDDCILSGVESRTSSPVRINRDETFQSSLRGLFPCGEGAGYAGGITSAAMDGCKCAEAVIRDLCTR